MIDQVVDVVFNILLLPLHWVLVPIDALLAKIPGLGIIPSSLKSIATLVGSIPSTLVFLSGASPTLWNSLFLVFVLYLSVAPGVNVVKKIWKWVRP